MSSGVCSWCVQLFHVQLMTLCTIFGMNISFHHSPIPILSVSFVLDITFACGESRFIHLLQCLIHCILCSGMASLNAFIPSRWWLYENKPQTHTHIRQTTRWNKKRNELVDTDSWHDMPCHEPHYTLILLLIFFPRLLVLQPASLFQLMRKWCFSRINLALSFVTITMSDLICVKAPADEAISVKMKLRSWFSIFLFWFSPLPQPLTPSSITHPTSTS